MKTKLLLGIIVAITLFSCSKETSPVSQESLARINSVVALTDLTSQKTAFTMLSAEEKSILWKKHLNDEMESGTFNKEQLKVIQSALNFATAEIFQAGTSFWASNDFEIWKVLVSKNFDKYQKAAVFGSIAAPSTISSKSTTTNSTGHPVEVNLVKPASCQCNSGQDFCGDRDWFSCAVNASYSCIPTQICTTNGGSGCGFFWSFACDGTCSPTYTPGLGC